MVTRFVIGLVAVSGLVFFAGCNPPETPLSDDTDTGTDSDSESESDSGGTENPCAGLSEGDPCNVPGMDGPVCDFGDNFLQLDHGHCDEDNSVPDGLVCNGEVVNCNDFEPPYCKVEANALVENIYSCVEPADSEAHCAWVESQATDCDDLAGSNFCGEDFENDTVYSSATYTCGLVMGEGACVPDAPVEADDCELYDQMCEDGACVDAPPCYEAATGDDCDTDVPIHCEGIWLVQQVGTCDSVDMGFGCVPTKETCAPLTCIEDTDGAHCG